MVSLPRQIRESPNALLFVLLAQLSHLLGLILHGVGGTWPQKSCKHKHKKIIINTRKNETGH